MHFPLFWLVSAALGLPCLKQILDVFLLLQAAQVGGGVIGAGGALYVLPKAWKG